MSRPLDREMLDRIQLPPPGFAAPAMPDAVPPAPRQRWHLSSAAVLAFLSWGVIVHFVVAEVVKTMQQEASPGGVAATNELNLYLMKTQARTLLGSRDVGMGGPGGDAQLYAEAQKSLGRGPVNQRLRFVVVAGELAGPEEALKKLDQLDAMLERKQVKWEPDQARQRNILRRLYRDYAGWRYDAPSVSGPDREYLHEKLEWFGDLALAPAGNPQAREHLGAVAGPLATAAPLRVEPPNPGLRKAVLEPGRVLILAYLFIYGGAFALALIGFVGLLLMALFLLLGRMRPGVVCGRSPAGVYIETFALWVFGLEILRVVLGVLGPVLDVGAFGIVISGVAMLLSLFVLGWPVLRGIPWRQVREDIGWTLGRRTWAEPFFGLGCYITCMPLLAVGLIIFLILTLMQQQLGGPPDPDQLTNPSSPSHPAALMVAKGDWWMWLMLFFVACIVAPLVEETLFRGILYRHLREATQQFRWFLSVVCSAFVSSFIFAVIHPQGPLGVPVLMALATGFVLWREWRGTLIPAMVAHGLNNFLALLMSILLLSR